MTEVDSEYFDAEYDHAVAVARAKVQDWDLATPHLLLEHLNFLREVVEQVAAEAARA
jgi:hypothetical protein